MARPFFSKARIADFEIFERTSRIALDLLTTRAELGQACDVQELISRFTLDSASEFLFGIKLDTLLQPLVEPGRAKLGPKGSMPIDGQTEFDSFTEAFEEVAVIITRRGAQGTTWPLTEFFHDKTQESIDVIFDWLDPLVRNALRRKTASSGSDATDGVFLDFLASSTDGEAHLFSSCICIRGYIFTCGLSDVEHIRYELVTYGNRDWTAH